ncbi:increased rDNA silencing protein 4 [Seiridium cupressi]
MHMQRPGTPNDPGRRLPDSSPAHDASAYQTALRGASLAFQKTGPSPGPSSAANASRTNGALIAATRISRQTTGNSIQDGSRGSPSIDHGAVSQRLTQLQSGQHQSPQNSNTALLKPPGGGRPNMGADPRSPSFIAATLAASRSGSPSPSQLPHAHAYAHQAATRVKRNNSTASSVPSLDLATDTTPIPPTNALISMFEKNKDGNSTSNNTDPVKKEPKLPPFTPPRAALQARQPEASPSRLASTLAWEQGASPPASIKELKRDAPQQAYTAALESKKRPPTPPTTRTSKPKRQSTGEPAKVIAKSKPRASTPPRPISRGDTVILSPQPRRTASHKMVRREISPEKETTPIPKKPPPPVVKPKPRPRSIHEAPSRPIAIPTRLKTAVSPRRRRSSASSNDTFVSASSVQTPIPRSPDRGRSPAQAFGAPPELPRRVRPSSAHSMITPNTFQRRNPVAPPPRRAHRSSNATLNTLADATMAGILASSRAPPSSSAASSPRPPSLPPPRKQTPHMRQTLRKPPSSSDDEESKWKARHRTKPLQSKKKHAHHEGARRRWREEITERERRRYEGVWASNRGSLLDSSSPETNAPGRANGTPPRFISSSPTMNDGDVVVNVIVRDLWSRSRLPIDELAEVWDLVDRTGRGMLDKVEFVVGMWLIDQRLRGRKIPQKVSDSVWASARGVSIKGPPKEKMKVKHKH